MSELVEVICAESCILLPVRDLSVAILEKVKTMERERSRHKSKEGGRGLNLPGP